MNLRDEVVMSLLRGEGHQPKPAEKGWVTCGLCGVSWWLAKRSEMADDPNATMTMADGEIRRIEDPLAFGRCEN